MSKRTSDIAFSGSVQAVQERLGSRDSVEKMVGVYEWASAVNEDLAAFIADRDSLYLGTASATGRPYIQHRGGPKGFLKVLDEHTLAFADYGGNRQYISLGNLAENDQAFIFLMDYASRRRVKIWGRAEVVEDDADLLGRVSDASYRKGRAERAIVFRVEAWDVNCPAHIPRLINESEASETVAELRARISELELENCTLRSRAGAPASS